MAKPSTYKRAPGTSHHTNTGEKNSIRFMESLEGSHEKFIARIANVQVSKQPYVMKYVLEALLEDAEENGIDLTEEDIGSLFILFKTLIEVLNKRA
jgi:hypothetical protein